MTPRAGYEPLAAVLSQALDQAQQGKGHERHAQGQPFDQQPMQKLIDLYGSGFALGQAAKKMQEAQRLPYERARAELLGAINYAAGAVIALDRMHLDGRLVVAEKYTEETLWGHYQQMLYDRPAFAPSWSIGTAVAGLGGSRLWIGDGIYAHAGNPAAVFKTDGCLCFQSSDMRVITTFPPSTAANDNQPTQAHG